MLPSSLRGQNADAIFCIYVNVVCMGSRALHILHDTTHGASRYYVEYPQRRTQHIPK